MSIRAEIDKNDVEKLSKLFIRAEKYVVKDAEHLIRQTMGMAITSAAIATKPRKKKSAKDGRRRGGKLTNKQKYRPLVKLPESMGNWYYQEGKYKPFKVKRKLTRSEMKKGNLVRITKAIKMWNRRGGGWKFLPYPGSKFSKKDRRFRIPAAGLAKEGWYRAAAAFDKKFTYESLRRNKNLHGIYVLTQGFMFMQVVNKVKYISKSSPASARYGLNKARKRMEKVWMPKIDKKIERDLKKTSGSYNKPGRSIFA